jgi:hypothetical protein
MIITIFLILSTSGPVKQKIIQTTDVSVLLCLFAMQTCVEWQKYQMVKKQSSKLNVGIIQKTGIVSFLIIIIISCNLLIDILFKTKSPDSYISRDFVSNFTLFVLGQGSIIFRNSTMKKFTKQWVCSAKDEVSSLFCFYLKKLQCKDNAVKPVV